MTPHELRQRIRAGLAATMFPGLAPDKIELAPPHGAPRPLTDAEFVREVQELAAEVIRLQNASGYPPSAHPAGTGARPAKQKRRIDPLSPQHPLPPSPAMKPNIAPAPQPASVDRAASATEPRSAARRHPGPLPEGEGEPRARPSAPAPSPIPNPQSPVPSAATADPPLGPPPIPCSKPPDERTFEEAVAAIRNEHDPGWEYSPAALAGLRYKRKAVPEPEPDGIFRGGTRDRMTEDRPITEHVPVMFQKRVAWLWQDRIPLGKLTVLAGPGGSGKSFVALDMAARVSRGAPWPDRPDMAAQGNSVLLLCGEDDLEDTVAPRLVAAGADTTRMELFTSAQSYDRVDNKHTVRPLAFPKDLEQLDWLITQHQSLRLVVIDPLARYCPDKKQLEETLRRLQEIAKQRNVAIVVTVRTNARSRSPRKLFASADPRYDAAPCVWNVIPDPADPLRRFLAPARLNFAPPATWVPFTINSRVVKWEGPLTEVEVNRQLAEALLKARPPTPEETDAMEWIVQAVGNLEVPSVSVFAEGRECGLKPPLLRRAAKRLGVHYVKRGFAGAGMWFWSLRPPPAWPLPLEDDDEEESEANAASTDDPADATAADDKDKDNKDKETAPADEPSDRRAAWRQPAGEVNLLRRVQRRREDQEENVANGNTGTPVPRSTNPSANESCEKLEKLSADPAAESQDESNGEKEAEPRHARQRTRPKKRRAKS